MRVAIFCHSIISDWNHGNAHFLRGIATEMLGRGFDVRLFEPVEGWSRTNLLMEEGAAAVAGFRTAYPHLACRLYDLQNLDLARAVDGCDLVLVHEWNEPELVGALGRLRRDGGRFRLLFHDTHHRLITEPQNMARYLLADYDGVLAFGRVLADAYRRRGQVRRAWVWHEAADLRVFAPRRGMDRQGDLVWIGNWGDEERSTELQRYLIEPVRELRLKAAFFGVRYPPEGLAALRAAGIDYAGWLANYRVPEVFGAYGATVHIPRRPYRKELPGIPTIRVFEALACGLPLVCLWWDDVEELFTPGADYLVARTPDDMRRHLRALLHDADLARHMAMHGRRTIVQRHTCAHRVDELLDICRELGLEPGPSSVAAGSELHSMFTGS